MTAGDMWHITGALNPSRRAVWFKGGNTDNYIQINAAAAARVAGNDTVGSWTAWINIPDITGTYCIMCAGDDNAVEFLEFNVEAGLLTSRCTDAAVVQFVSQEDAVGLTPHKWHHVSMVQAAGGQGIQFYIDGVRTASTNDTAADVNEWFVNLDGIDTMRIGAANKVGDASVTNEFVGGISNVKIFIDVLTPTEVMEDYQGIVNTNNLHNHWDFDNDFVDVGSGLDNGTLVGTSATLCPAYSEFTSRYNSITTPVAADTILFSATESRGDLIVIKAA